MSGHKRIMWMDWTFHNLTILARGKQLRYFNSTWQSFYIDSFIAANRDAPIYWRCEWLSESQKSVCKAPWAPSSANLLNMWALQNVLEPPKPDSHPSQQSQTAQYSQTHPASSSVARIRLQRYNVQLAIYNALQCAMKNIMETIQYLWRGGCNQFISKTLHTCIAVKTLHFTVHDRICLQILVLLPELANCSETENPMCKAGTTIHLDTEAGRQHSFHNIW